MFRWAFRLLVLAIVLVIGLILLKDTLLKEAAEERIRAETGLEVRIGKLDAGLFRPTLTIQDLVIYNAAEFGGGPFFDIPDLHLEYDYGLPSEGVTLKLLRLNIRELHLVESQAGQTNLMVLLARVAPESLRKKDGTGGEESGFGGIGMLNLSVGKVRYTSLKNPRRNQEIPVGMKNEIIQDVRTEEDLTAILLKVLLRAGITIYDDASAFSSGARVR